MKLVEEENKLYPSMTQVMYAPVLDSSLNKLGEHICSSLVVFTIYGLIVFFLLVYVLLSLP